MALGLTQTLPAEDRYNLTKEQILAMIKHAMGGRAAEDLVFAQFSTGASNDLKQATDLAKRMICKYGMSDRLGPVSFGDDDQDVFLGRDFISRKDYSEKKAEEIDEEVSTLLRELYDDARRCLADNRPTLERIAEALLERETLDTADLKLLVAGQPLPPMPAPPVAPPPRSEPPRRVRADRKPEVAGDKLPEPEPMPS
jgi:cell division protease FtsH